MTLCSQNAGYKGPVQTANAAGPQAGGSVLYGNLSEVCSRQIRVAGIDRPIDEPDSYFSAARGMRH
jgi:hypothetical protein